MELTVNELRDLVAALSQSDIAELTLKSSTFELTLRKQGGIVAAAPIIVEGGAPGPVKPMETVVTEAPVATPTTPPVAPPGKASDLLTISSPMVGTFYRAPAPDEASFGGHE